jgi:hypothetical protein
VKPTANGITIIAAVTAMSAYPCRSGGMTRTISVNHAVSTASTAAPAPKTSAITVAASPSVCGARLRIVCTWETARTIYAGEVALDQSTVDGFREGAENVVKDPIDVAKKLQPTLEM